MMNFLNEKSDVVKYFFSHFLSALLGAFFVVIVMIGFNKLAAIYPIYLPNLFYKEQINYSVNVDSQVSIAISQAVDNVVQVNNYLGEQLQGTGSGVIYKLTQDKAYVVTNYHVIQNASGVEIETNKGYKVYGEIIGSDAVTDLAVVSIPKGSIDHKMEFSDSNTLKVGEYVIAIGNPLGLSSSATLGIISSTERLVPVDTDNDDKSDWYASVLQTDAPINPGNSGGALINLAGKMVGINSMKIAEQDVEGIGFSIPTNLVSRIIADIETNGEVYRPIRLLGITIQSALYKGDLAYKIIEVQEGSQAQKIDLRVGDIISEINNKEIVNIFDLKYFLSTANVNDIITITVIRNGEIINKEVIVTD